MRIMFSHCNGYQNYINVHTSNVIVIVAKCSNKPLAKVLTYFLTAGKTGIQRYHNTSFSRSGIHQMWILKNSNDLLVTRSQYVCKSIIAFDVVTFYTTISLAQRKSIFKKMNQRCFSRKNAQRRYQNLVLHRDNSYTQNIIIQIDRTRSFKC